MTKAPSEATLSKMFHIRSQICFIFNSIQNDQGNPNLATTTTIRIPIIIIQQQQEEEEEKIRDISVPKTLNKDASNAIKRNLMKGNRNKNRREKHRLDFLDKGSSNRLWKMCAKKLTTTSNF